MDKLQILPLWNFYKILGGWQSFFPHFKTNVSHDPLGQIRGQDQGQKITAPKLADSGSF